ARGSGRPDRDPVREAKAAASSTSWPPLSRFCQFTAEVARMADAGIELGVAATADLDGLARLGAASPLLRRHGATAPGLRESLGRALARGDILIVARAVTNATTQPRRSSLRDFSPDGYPGVPGAELDVGADSAPGGRRQGAPLRPSALVPVGLAWLVL